MQPALDRITLDHLISLGRRQGHLTTEDLRASLPVETMSAEEIALIVVHLEETGVPVELEESLLSPNPKPQPVPRKSAEIIPFPGPEARNRKKLKPKPLKPAPAPAASQETEVKTKPVSYWIYTAAGLLALAVFGLIIFAMH
jgi:hypothetical protein